MLNEERIVLMTHMASYEQNEGRQYMSIGKYFRSDYVAVQVIKSMLCAAVSYVMCLALYIFYHFDTFMENIYAMDLIAFVQKILIYFAVTVAVYSAISYVICSYRYAKAKKSLKCYYQNLKKLNTLYEE